MLTETNAYPPSVGQHLPGVRPLPLTGECETLPAMKLRLRTRLLMGEHAAKVWRFKAQTANYLLPVVCLLFAATAHAQIEIIPPAEPIEVHRAIPLEVRGLTAEDVDRSAVIYDSTSTTMVSRPFILGGKVYLCFQPAAPGQHFVAIAISNSEGRPDVGSITLDVGGSPPEPPPEPDDLATKTATWLQDVPEEARTEPVENPMTGTTMSRQQAVGTTYRTIAKVAEALGSVQATNVMLKTGLDASFGDAVDDWQPFADRVAGALVGITDAVEYGAALAIVGGALE